MGLVGLVLACQKGRRELPGANYGIRATFIPPGRRRFNLSNAIMQAANQKANGSRSGARISALMALALSSDATPQVFAKGHPRFFVREIHKG